MNGWVTAERRHFYDEHGYVVIPEMLSGPEVTEINREFMKLWLDLVREGIIVQDNRRSLESVFPRLRDYHQSRPAIAALLLSGKMFDVAAGLLGEEALAISTSYYFKGPGTRGLPMHQDNYSVGAAPTTTCSLWLSLSVSHEDNGGVYVVPGSHKLGLLSPEPVQESRTEYGEKLGLPEGYETVPLRTQPGDLVAFHGNLLHGSEANLSGRTFRYANVTHFMGVSAERVALNYNYLLDRSGARIRRRLNAAPKLKNDILKKDEWSGVGGNRPWR